MDINRKRGLAGVRIVGHNKILLWVILVLFIILIALVIGIIYLGNIERQKSALNSTLNSSLNSTQNSLDYSCTKNSDCVPASCCHASSCISINNAPICSRIACSMGCKPGTMDCGQASCVCQNNKCAVVDNKLSSRV